MSEKMNPLNEKEMEGISGGLIIDASGMPGSDSLNPLEIIDDITGEVRGKAHTYDAATEFANAMGISVECTDDLNRILDLRNGAH